MGHDDVSGLKDLAFGSIAGSCSKVFEHPFDLCKVRLQSQPPDRPARFTGPLDCLRQTWSREGVRGLYRGLSAPIVGAAAENACLFLVYNQIQRLIEVGNGRVRSDGDGPVDKPLGELALAAAGAGAAASFILTPIELVKVKMQVTVLAAEGLVDPASAAKVAGSIPKRPNFSSLPGPIAILRQTVAATGLRGLWLGHSGTLLRETGGSSAWFTTFEVVSRQLMRRREKLEGKAPGSIKREDLSTLEVGLAGACAGISYNIVLFPADTIKSAIQTRAELRPDLASSAPASFLGTAKEIFAARGVRGLYAGCGITVARAAPSSALIFLIYENLARVFA